MYTASSIIPEKKSTLEHILCGNQTGTSPQSLQVHGTVLKVVRISVPVHAAVSSECDYQEYDNENHLRLCAASCSKNFATRHSVDPRSSSMTAVSNSSSV